MLDVTVRAPEWDPDLSWLNAPRPLTMRELRGQLVILDFWTYCCVNCMHVAPVLRQLEERFAKEPLVVIGVHSAKFDGEKDAARIAEAMGRYEIAHPVLVDRDMRTWSAFAVRSWPTLVVVRPDGTIAAVAPGEPELDVLTRFVESELALARKKGTLAAAPFAAHVPARASESGPLAYPGKVAVGPDGAIAVADSGHHRVLVLDGAGNVRFTIGSGLAGHADGSLEDAAFDDPQGIAWKSATELFVADARAHTVAAVDLAARRVTTIAGTGELGALPLDLGASAARDTALRSPWDLLLDGDTLYVAMAGSHQIAVVDLRAGTVARLAGTGAESIVDGTFAESTFSQPSGLALVGRILYVADSETSAVRALDLDARTVRTVVGVGLFDFGDQDGPRDVARMQHCIGIAADARGMLVVADTYNHKLRAVDAASGEVRTVAPTAGSLAEPGGLAWESARGGWLVADTNHHRLVRVSASGSLAPLEVRDAPDPMRGRVAVAERLRGGAGVAWFTTLLVAKRGAALAPETAHAEIAVPVRAPSGKKLAAGAPLVLTIEVSRRSDLIVPRATELRVESAGGTEQRVVIDAAIEPFGEPRIEAELVVRVDCVVCDVDADAEGAACEPYRELLRVPVRLDQKGGARVDFEASAP